MKTISWISFILLLSLPFLSIAQPVVNLGADTTVCANNLTLDAQNPTALSYLWNTGEVTQTISADSTGLYWVSVTDVIGSTIDSIYVVINITPVFTVQPNDTAICEGSYQLMAAATAGVMQWRDSSGAALGFGNTLDYVVTNTTRIWYEASHYEVNPTLVGRVLAGGGSGYGGFTGRGIHFDVFEPIILNSVTIDINNGPFTARIDLEDATGTIIHTLNISYPSAGAYVVPLGFNVPVGTGYTIYMRNVSGAATYTMFPFSNWAAYTYPFMSLTGSTFAGSYPFFYEWNVSTLTNSCSSGLDSVLLTGLPTPTVNLGNDTTLCGDSLLLDAGAGFDYVWSTGTGATTQTYMVTTTGTYKVTVSFGGNCPVEDSIFVHVDIKPSFTQTPNDTALCEGPIQLTAATTAGIIEWMDSTGNTIGYGDTLDYTLQDTTRLWFQASHFETNPTLVGRVLAGGGSGYTTATGRGIRFDVFEPIILQCVTIDINGGPFSATIDLEDATGVIQTMNISYSSAGTYVVPLNFSIPIGTGYTLYMRNVTGGGTYTQFPFTNWAAYTYPFMSLTGSTFSGSYPYFYEWKVATLGGACSSGLDSVLLNSLPTPSVALRSDTTLCGDSILLDATNVGPGFVYAWNTTLASTPTIMASTTDMYKVTVSVGGNCPVEDSVMITVDIKPSFISMPANQAACAGMIPLVANATAGTIEWLDSSGTVLGYGDTLLYNLVDTSTVWFQASQYEVNPTVVGRALAGGGSGYTSASDRGIFFNVTEPIILNSVTIDINGGPFSATVVLTDGAGATIGTVPVNYPAAGTYVIPLNFSIPIGTGYTLYLNNVTGGQTYTMFPFTNWAAYTYPFMSLTGSTFSGSYPYFYEWNVSTLGNTCSSGLESVTLNRIPTPVVNLGNDTTICGGTKTLDATNTGGSFSYAWSTGESTAMIVTDSTGVYSVTVSLGGNCPVSDVMNLEVLEKPIITAHPVDTSICGGYYQITAAASAGTLQWMDSSRMSFGYGDTILYQLQNTTTIWYEASQYEPNPTVVGRVLAGGGSGYTTASGRGIRFNVTQPIILNTVKIDIDGGPFSATIDLENAAGQIIATKNIAYGAAGTYVVQLDFPLAVASGYTLYMRNVTGAKTYTQFPFTSWGLYTYPFIDLTGSTFAGSYPYFYEWGVSTLGSVCSSGEDSLTLTMLATPEISLQTDTVVCNDSLTVDVFYPGASYEWGTTGVTTSSIIITTEGMYHVTASIGSCEDNDSIAVYLNPNPVVNILSNDTITCVGLIPRIASGADVFDWYDEAVGGNYLGTGSLFMYNAQTSDTIWAEGQNFSNKAFDYALPDTAVTANSGFYFPVETRGLIFHAHENILLNEVTIYTGTGGFQGNFELWDENDVVLYSLPGFFPSAGAQAVVLDFNIPAGQNYKLVITNYSVTPLYWEYPYNNYPIVGDKVTIVKGLPFELSYNYFYDWKVKGLDCPSERVFSVVDVLPTPNIDFPTDSIICGDTLVLDATASMANTFLWSTGDTTAVLVIDSSMKVSLTGTIGVCSATDSMNVFVVQPPDLILPPADTTVCQGNLTLYTSGNAAYYAWYDSSNSVTPFALGDSVVINMQDTSTIWVEGIGFIPKSTPVGAIYDPASNLNFWFNPETSIFPTRGLSFDVNTPILLNSLKMYVDTATTGTLVIYKSSFPYYVQSLNLTNVGENIVQIDTLLEPGNYFIELSNKSSGKILMLTPYTNFNQLNTPEITFTGSAPMANRYNYFFEWKISTPSCATDRLPVNVNVSPSPPISMVADTATCTLSSLVLDPIAVNNPAYTYLWNNNSPDDTLLVTTSGYYSVTVTNDGLCSSVQDILVQFLSTPNGIQVNDTSICSPQYVDLGSPSSDGIVVWYDSANLGQAIHITAPYTAYVADTSDFWVDVAPRATTRLGVQSAPNPNEASAYLNFIIANTFDVHEFSILDSVAIYVDVAPATVVIDLMDSLGNTLNSTTFTVNQAHQKVFVPLNYLIPPGQKYQLSFSSIGTLFLVDQNPIAAPTSSSGIATLTGTVFSGVNYSCFFDWHFSYAYSSCHAAADTFNVSVNMPTALPDSLYTCDSVIVDLTHPSVNSYTWSNGSITGMTTLYNAGVYMVTISDGAMCTVVDTVSITKPVPVGLPTGNAVCDSLLFTNYTAANATFLWSTGDTTPTITIPTTGIYYVTVTTNGGCVLVDTAAISQIVLAPEPNLGGFANPVRICETAILDAGFGGQGMSYLWSTGAITQTIIVDSAAIYSVTVTHPLGCAGSSFVLVIDDDPPVANFSVNKVNYTVQLVNLAITSAPNATFQWIMGDGSPITTSPSDRFYTYADSGCYYASLIVTDDCGTDTFTQLIPVMVPDSVCYVAVASLNAPSTDLGFQIVPNPNTGLFQLELTTILEEETQLMMYDVNGRIVHQQQLLNSGQTKWEVKTNNLADGIYFVRLVNSQQSKTERIVILRA